MALRLADIQDLRSILPPEGHQAAPGYAISVQRHGERVDGLCVGLANLEHRVPIGRRTRFHVASLAKQFTAFAVALLEADGTLDMDEYASKWIPECPVLEGIRVRHLVHHTSGIRDQWVLSRLAGWRSNDTILFDDAFTLIRQQRRLQFAPGERFLYSNSGYTLLARIVASAAGEEFCTALRRRIFEPLGMHDTSFIADPGQVVPDRADAYAAGSDAAFARHFPNLFVPGPTSLVTTIADMEKWDRNFYRPTVGSPELLDRVRVPGTLNDGRSCSYAYGLIRPESGDIHAYHTGMDFGFHSYYAQYRDGLGIAILSNASPPTLWELAQSLAHAFGSASLPRPPMAVGAPADCYAGVYEDPARDTVVTVDVRAGELILVMGRLAVLRPAGTDRFRQEGSPTECHFSRDSSGRAIALRIVSPNSHDELTRVETSSRSRLRPDAMIGRFWSSELGCVAQIAHDDRDLVLQLPKLQRTALLPVTEDLLVTDSGWVRLRRAAETVTGFELSEQRARGILFERVDMEAR